MIMLQGSHRVNSSPKTDISFTLGALESEVDITIVDRINSLIKPEPTKRPYSTSVATNLTGGVCILPPYYRHIIIPLFRGFTLFELFWN